MVFSAIRDSLSDLYSIAHNIWNNPEEMFFAVFDAFLGLILGVLSFILVGVHEISMGFLTYTPYPGKPEGDTVIFGTPESGDIFYTMITFNRDFIEPFALLIVFFGIIFLLFIRIFDIMIEGLGINTSEGMKRLFIAPLIIVLWLPIANLLLFFAYGMTNWLTEVELSGVEDMVREDHDMSITSGEDETEGHLSIESYINLLGRDEDVGGSIGTVQATIGIFYGISAVLIASIIYLFVLFGAVIRVIGLIGYYALAPIGVVLWAFKWRGFAKIGTKIVRNFILLALFPIGVGFVNLMAPPIFIALLSIIEDIYSSINFSMEEPMGGTDESNNFAFTDIIPQQEAGAFLFIILTPILVGIVPWGIVIGFDKAMTAAKGAAVAGVGAAAVVGTGGAALGGLGAAKGVAGGASGLMSGAKKAKSGMGTAYSEVVNTEKRKKNIMNAKSKIDDGKDYASNIPSRMANKRENVLDRLGNTDKFVNENINKPIEDKLDDPIDTVSSAAGRVGGAARTVGGTARSVGSRQMDKLDNTIGEGLYAGSKFIDENTRKDLEDSFINSNFIGNRMGGGTAQQIAKSHRDGEKFLDKKKVLDEEYSEDDIMDELIFRDRGKDGDVSSEDPLRALLKRNEAKTVGNALKSDDKLVEKFAKENGLNSDEVTSDLLAKKFFKGLENDNLENIFSYSGANKAIDIFEGVGDSDIQDAIDNSSKEHAEYVENEEAINELKDEIYDGDMSNTLLNQEKKHKLYDETYIPHLDSQFAEISDNENVWGQIENAIAENSSEDVHEISETFVKSLARQGISVENIEDEIANNSDLTLDGKNVDVVGIKSAIDAAVQDKSYSGNVNPSEGGEHLEEFYDEVKKSANRTGISERELENSTGAPVENVASRYNDMRNGQATDEQIMELMEHTQFDGETGEAFARNAIKKMCKEMDMNQMDVASMIDENEDLFNNDIGSTFINEMAENLDGKIAEANKKGGTNYNYENTSDVAESVLRTYAKEVGSLDESDMKNITNKIDLESEYGDGPAKLLGRFANEATKDAVEQYVENDVPIENSISSIGDSEERQKVIQELDEFR